MGLFDIKDNVIIKKGIEFNIFDEDSIKIFDNYCKNVTYDRISCFSSIGHLYPMSILLSKSKNNLVWKEIYGYIFIFNILRNNRIYMYSQPIPMESIYDKEKEKEAFRMAIELMYSFNDKEKSKDVMEFVSAETVKDFIPLEKLKHAKAFNEFIFRCDDLIELKGSKYKNRRGMVNYFKKNFPNHVIRYATEDDIPAIMELRELWIENVKARTKVKTIWDEKLFPIIIDNWKTLDYKITVCEVDGIIRGYCIIRWMCNDCMFVVAENCDDNFKGITEYLWYESLRLNRHLGTYENDSNGGKENDSLYKYKLNHRPIGFYESYNITIRDKGEKLLDV